MTAASTEEDVTKATNNSAFCITYVFEYNMFFIMTHILTKNQ